MSLAADIATNIGENAAIGTTHLERDEHFMSKAANIDNEATGTTHVEHDKSKVANIANNIGEKEAKGNTRLERDEDDKNYQTDLIDLITECE